MSTRHILRATLRWHRRKARAAFDLARQLRIDQPLTRPAHTGVRWG